MEISEEQLNSFLVCLNRVGNHIDQDLCSLADKGQELKRLMTDVDIMKYNLNELTKQAPEGPS